MKPFVARVLFLLFLLVVFACPVHSQSLRLGWDQPAPQGSSTFTSAMAQAYVYKYYLVGGTNSGTTIAAVACTTTNAPLVKFCSAPLPTPLQGGQQINVTASNPLGESGHSNDLELPPPPPAPLNLRSITAALVRPFRAFGSRLRGR